MSMSSGTVVGEGKDGEREKQRYSENKVYTRKVFKGSKKNNLLNSAVSNPSINNNNNTDIDVVKETAVTATAADPNNNGNNDDNNGNHSVQIPARPLPLEFGDSAQQQPGLPIDTAVSDDCSSLKEQPAVAGVLKPSSENQGKINLASRSKQEVVELRRKLMSELDLVRNLLRRIEAKEQEINGFRNSLPSNDAVHHGFDRAQPELASVGISQEPVKKSRPLNQLNISSLENSRGTNENMEKGRSSTEIIVSSLYNHLLKWPSQAKQCKEFYRRGLSPWDESHHRPLSYSLASCLARRRLKNGVPNARFVCHGGNEVRGGSFRSGFLI